MEMKDLEKLTLLKRLEQLVKSEHSDMVLGSKVRGLFNLFGKPGN